MYHHLQAPGGNTGQKSNTSRRKERGNKSTERVTGRAAFRFEKFTFGADEEGATEKRRKRSEKGTEQHPHSSGPNIQEGQRFEPECSHLCLTFLGCVYDESRSFSVPGKNRTKAGACDIAAAASPDDDFDTLISAVMKADAVCSFVKCKASVQTLGQLCIFCNRQYCLSHHIPEVNRNKTQQ